MVEVILVWAASLWGRRGSHDVHASTRKVYQSRAQELYILHNQLEIYAACASSSSRVVAGDVEVPNCDQAKVDAGCRAGW